MSNEVWITIGIIFVVVWILIIWEAWNTPVTPDEVDKWNKDKKGEPISYKDAFSETILKGEFKDTGLDDPNTYRTGFYNGKTDKWIKNK